MKGSGGRCAGRYLSRLGSQRFSVGQHSCPSAAKTAAGTSASPPLGGAATPSRALVSTSLRAVSLVLADTDAPSATLRPRHKGPDAPIFGAVCHSKPRLCSLGYDDGIFNQLSRSRHATTNATLLITLASVQRLLRCLRHPFSALPATISSFLTSLVSSRNA